MKYYWPPCYIFESQDPTIREETIYVFKIDAPILYSTPFKNIAYELYILYVAAKNLGKFNLPYKLLENFWKIFQVRGIKIQVNGGGTDPSMGSLTPRVGHRISRKHEEALKALTTFETAVF